MIDTFQIILFLLYDIRSSDKYLFARFAHIFHMKAFF